MKNSPNYLPVIFLIMILVAPQPGDARGLLCSIVLKGSSLFKGASTVKDKSYTQYKYVMHEGLQRKRGREQLGTIVGTRAIVRFQEFDSNTDKTFEGRVIDAYQAQVNVMDEKTGEIHVLNANHGEFKDVQIQELKETTVTVHKTLDDIKDVIANDENALVLLAVTPNDETQRIFGTIKVNESTPHRKVIEITDSQGHVHRIDPAEDEAFGYRRIYAFSGASPAPKLFPIEHSRPIEMLPKEFGAETRAGTASEPYSFEKRELNKDEIAALPAKTSIENVGPLLTESQRSILIKNLSFMGIDKTKYPQSNHGTEESWSTLLWNGLSVVRSTNKANGDLLSTLLTDYSSPRQLQIALDAWAEGHNINYRMYFYDDIVEAGKVWKASEEGADQSVFIENNGYIPSGLYNKMMSEGMLPIADPHDPLMHLTALTNPRYNSDLSRFSRLKWTLVKHMGGDGVERAEKFKKLKETQPVLYSLAYLDQIMAEPIRYSTHENWSYLVDTGAGPEFFMQGNAPFNGIHDLMNGEFSEFVSRFVNLQGRDLSLKNPGQNQLRSLPFLSEFLNSREGLVADFKNLDTLFEKHGLSADSYAKMASRINDFLY